MLNYTDKNIVAAYTTVLEGLSNDVKQELIKSLSQSLKGNKETKNKHFYESFGAFASEKPAEEINSEIKNSRKFRKKEIKF